MISIDPSVLPSLADTFRSCGELMSGIMSDLQQYMRDVSHKFHEQSIILAERTDKAARQLKETKERQKEATKTRELAIGHYKNSVHNLGVLKGNLKRAKKEGEWYEGEREDIKQEIRDQYETIEANELNMNSAIADFEQVNIELQNAQSTYDDAKYRLEESKRIVGDFDKLHDQFRARLEAPNKDIRIDDRSIRVSQNYSIKTMLEHLSKDYIDKAVVALDAVQQKVDAILSIGRQHFGCNIAPTRVVMPTTSGTGVVSRKNIIAPQGGSQTFCPICRQMKAICRCNEIVDKTIKSYIHAKEIIPELMQEAKELKAKIDRLQPLENASYSLRQNIDEEIDQIRREKENLLNEYSTRELNTDNYWKDHKRALVQAAWDREKDDEKVYRSQEMDALRNEVDGMRRENRLLEDKANQLDDVIEKKKLAAFDAISEKRKARELEERRLGGTLEDFKTEYKKVTSRLKWLKSRLPKYKNKLKNYGVKIDNEGNIITVRNE